MISPKSQSHRTRFDSWLTVEQFLELALLGAHGSELKERQSSARGRSYRVLTRMNDMLALGMSDQAMLLICPQRRWTSNMTQIASRHGAIE